MVSVNQIQSRRASMRLTPREMAARAGIGYQSYLQLENLKVLPIYRRTGEWKPAAIRLARFLYSTPESLFPLYVVALQRRYSAMN